MYIRALQGYEEALGPKHTSTLETVNNLGIALRRPRQAGGGGEDVHSGAARQGGGTWTEAHIDTRTVNNLGLLYADQGKLAEAEKMYSRALQGKEKAWGPEHTSTLDTVNNLGNLYAALGKLEEAEKMYQRALKGYEKALGADNTTTYIPALTTIQNLGSLFERQADIGKARKMYSKALGGYKTIVGADDSRSRKLTTRQTSYSGRCDRRGGIGEQS